MTVHGGLSFEDWQVQKFVPAGRRRLADMVGERFDMLIGDLTLAMDDLGGAFRRSAGAMESFAEEYVRAARVALPLAPAFTVNVGDAY